MEKLPILHLTFFLLVGACFLKSSLAGYDLSPDDKNLVKAQIVAKMKISLFYQTYGHYFENSNQALHGFAKYFLKQSLKNKKHADKMMSYLNDRGVSFETFSKINEFCLQLKKPDDVTYCKKVIGSEATVDPVADFPQKAITHALVYEKKDYKELEDLVTEATDKQLKHFINHKFLDEQSQYLKELKDYKTQLSSNKEVVPLLLDHWLLQQD